MKSNLTFNKWARTLSLVLTGLLLSTGCAEKDAGGTYVVGINMGGYTTAQKIMHAIVPQAHAAVSDLKFCFKRLRFKAADTDSADPSADEDNVDFDLGEVSIDASGTNLGAIALPAGTYGRLEFDLEDHCSSGHSVSLINDNGTFTTNARITVKFSGNWTLESDSTINLDVQTFLDAANSYNGSATLRDTIEAVSGSL